MGTVLLAGFSEAVERPLSRKLSDLGYSVQCAPAMDAAGEVDLLFVAEDDPRAMRSMSHRMSYSAPVVVVSRIASDAGWIRALEWGAADYCDASIDPENLRWIVQNAAGRKYRAHAAA